MYSLSLSQLPTTNGFGLLNYQKKRKSTSCENKMTVKEKELLPLESIHQQKKFYRLHAAQNKCKWLVFSTTWVASSHISSQAISHISHNNFLSAGKKRRLCDTAYYNVFYPLFLHHHKNIHSLYHNQFVCLEKIVSFTLLKK